MKRVYLVRHGETKANLTESLQSSEEPLSAVGMAQAQKIAERMKHFPIERALVSDYVRTKQTAKVIEELAGITFEESILFREARVPTKLIGVARKDDAYREYTAVVAEHGDDPDWHFDDEENLPELKERALKAWEYLDSLNETDILVVTHGQFLRHLLGVLIFGEKYSFSLFLSIVTAMPVSNVGLSICYRDEERWRLLTWNDHAHLGE